MKRATYFHSSVMRSITALALMHIASNAYAAGPKVTIVPVPSHGQPMATKTDSNGTIHLVFDTSDGPQYIYSKDNGKTLSEPIMLIDQDSRKPGLEFITWDMAVSSEGVVHVAIGNNAWKLKLPKEEWGFFYTRLRPGEKALITVSRKWDRQIVPNTIETKIGSNV